MASRTDPEEVPVEALGEGTDEDSVDRHVARWSSFEGLDPEVEGATTRIQAILRHLDRGTHARFTGDDTLEDYKTLHALHVNHTLEEATPAQLADDCHVTRAAMTSRIDRLVDRGHVTREVDPTDRRRILVRPTPTGTRLWKRSLRDGIDAEKQSFTALSREELVQLNGLLRKVLRDLESR
jgi:DNA-binding MarR family transcriptional regulator